MHSLADNQLAGETGTVDKSKQMWDGNRGKNVFCVQGSSFRIGAKVTYEGRKMTVSKALDSYGDIEMVDMSGVFALAAALPEAKSLRSLECAAASP